MDASATTRPAGLKLWAVCGPVLFLEWNVKHFIPERFARPIRSALPKEGFP